MIKSFSKMFSLYSKMKEKNKCIWRQVGGGGTSCAFVTGSDVVGGKLHIWQHYWHETLASGLCKVMNRLCHIPLLYPPLPFASIPSSRVSPLRQPHFASLSTPSSYLSHLHRMPYLHIYELKRKGICAQEKERRRGEICRQAVADEKK